MPYLGTTSGSTPTTTANPLQSFGSALNTLGSSVGKGFSMLGIGNNATLGGGTVSPTSSSVSGQPIFGTGLTLSGSASKSGTGERFTPVANTNIGTATQQNTASSALPTLNFTTPNGGQITLDVAGNPQSFTSATGGYAINVPTTVDSSMATNAPSYSDILAKRNQYQDYVQGLKQATQLSPEYINAMNTLNRAKEAEAQLQSNYYTGYNLPGDTLGYAGGVTQRAQAQNQLAQLTAGNTLAVQEAIRQGNIDAYKALVGAAEPTSLSYGQTLVSPLSGSTIAQGGSLTDQQAIETFYNLGQTYPDAAIQWDNSLTPQQNVQAAQQQAQSSPSFQARNLVSVSLPGGGYTFVNKNQILTDPTTGQSIVISSADATQAEAAQKAYQDINTQQANLSTQINTLDNNFPILTNIVQQYNLNKGVPLYNQLNQLADRQLGQTGVYQLQSIATGLKATISQIVSRGGSVSNKTREEADALLPENVSYKVLQDLYNVIKQEGEGVIKSFDSVKQQQLNTLNSIYQKNSSGSTTNNTDPLGLFS